MSQEWVQDKSRVMVIIGSDTVSLYPSLTKEESANEVAEAVLESNIKWDGVNWKEAVRFLVLGRDEAWCRSSGLGRVLPWRKHKNGTRPGLTGVGPMGAAEDDENQWEFKRDLELTQLEKESNIVSNETGSGNNVWNPHIHLWGKKLQAEGGGPDRVKEYLCARKSGHGKMGLQVEGEDGREQH